MIAGGEDPKFISRRLVVTAAEDVGMADPQALVVANAAAQSVTYLGWPEARITLAQAVIYVAKAPKDNSGVVAIDSALNDIEKKGLSFPVPDHLKDNHYHDAGKYGFGNDCPVGNANISDAISQSNNPLILSPTLSALLKSCP